MCRIRVPELNPNLSHRTRTAELDEKRTFLKLGVHPGSEPHTRWTIALCFVITTAKCVAITEGNRPATKLGQAPVGV